MRDLLDEVSKWKLEAADEDSKRFFYHTNEVESLEAGQDSVVIGRKGTGKTAICRYFETESDYNRFSLKLSFKEFPFNLLYSLEDKNFTNPSQYISLWKYFIYNSVLKLMVSNSAIDAEFHRRLKDHYTDDEFENFGSLMETWTRKAFGAGILSLSGNHEVERAEAKIEEIWPDLIPAMERMIVRNIDSSRYYIVFDELDEDYRNYWDKESRTRYLSLITSLLKAISNVRRVFSDHDCNIMPIVFLRDDIYELLSDPDKNKWEDHLINLSWKRAAIKNMLAFRIARSRDPHADRFDFETEWINLFQHDSIRAGNGRQIATFDYILSLTHSRPRDFVRILKDAAKSSINQGHKKITNDTIKGVDINYSGKFREELVTEIDGVIPDISNLLAHFGATRKQRYRYEVFINHIEAYQKAEGCHEQTRLLSPAAITKILFHFSIVGNADRRSNRPIYKYQRTHLSVNPSEPLVFHRGLLKTMGLH